MTRETYKKQFGGVEVEFVAALNAGEAMDIDDIAQNSIQVKLTENGDREFQPVSVGAVERATREAIATACIVSIAGQVGDIVQKLRSLSQEQYKDIYAECIKIKDGLSEEKKSE